MKGNWRPLAQSRFWLICSSILMLAGQPELASWLASQKVSDKKKPSFKNGGFAKGIPKFSMNRTIKNL